MSSLEPGAKTIIDLMKLEDGGVLTTIGGFADSEKDRKALHAFLSYAYKNGVQVIFAPKPTKGKNDIDQ